MCFSWEDFLEGNKKPYDKVNLGLHEFAHALRFNGIKGDDTDYFFENYFPKWVSCATKEFLKLRNNAPSIFRKYGGVNINEFFSVAVETFFESPEEFKSASPDLFLHTSILLNQTINDNNQWISQCREVLLGQTTFVLSNNYLKALRYHLPYNGYLVGVIGFLFVGLFSLLGEGYKYPPAYICFAIACLFWSMLERKYTRLLFNHTKLTIAKGFFFLKNYKSITIQGAQLISIVGKYENVVDNEGHLVRKMGLMTITHYKNHSFYEDDIECEINQEEFDKLCTELKQNYIHVFMMN